MSLVKKKIEDIIFQTLNHGPTVMVSSIDNEGNPDACAVSWYTFVTNNPPRVSIVLAKSHEDYHNIKMFDGKCVINVVDSSMIDAMWYTGCHSARDTGDKAESSGHEFDWADSLSKDEVWPKWVDQAVGHLECKLDSEMEYSGMSVMIFNVINCYVRSDMWSDTDGWVTGSFPHHFGCGRWGKTEASEAEI
eukprot:TRINITY_DN9309_c0_g1_i1.p1 TRINITY_DN9309_c0_g1~~TRINITY_DN9309_c0_g1_i1.p1  ORF type:complete len:191 (+),score=40.18 TRINITY_DN9309_c0_g1_i1:208-780(+)